MPTALLSLLEERKNQQNTLKKGAMAEVKRLSSLLKKRFGFEALYLGGSLFTDKFRIGSDLDLIIKGMKIEDFFKAYALLLRESRHPVDLKPFEDLGLDFKKKILEGGMRVG